MRENVNEWREAVESKRIRINLGKTKLIVSGMEIDLCGVCGMSHSMLCTVCGKWVHARCKDKKVTVYFDEDFVCKKCGSMVKNLKGPDEIL